MKLPPAQKTLLGKSSQLLNQWSKSAWCWEGEWNSNEGWKGKKISACKLEEARKRQGHNSTSRAKSFPGESGRNLTKNHPKEGPSQAISQVIILVFAQRCHRQIFNFLSKINKKPSPFCLTMRRHCCYLVVINMSLQYSLQLMQAILQRHVMFQSNV